MVRAAIVTTIVAVAALTGCSADSSSSAGSADDEVVRMWIEPELVECTGVGPMECMQVAYSEGGETQYFYDSIVGFDYQEGTAYVIDVAVTEVENPPADASSLSYSLVDIISMEPQ